MSLCMWCLHSAQRHGQVGYGIEFCEEVWSPPDFRQGNLAQGTSVHLSKLSALGNTCSWYFIKKLGLLAHHFGDSRSWPQQRLGSREHVMASQRQACVWKGVIVWWGWKPGNDQDNNSASRTKQGSWSLFLWWEHFYRPAARSHHLLTLPHWEAGFQQWALGIHSSHIQTWSRYCKGSNSGLTLKSCSFCYLTSLNGRTQMVHLIF